MLEIASLQLLGQLKYSYFQHAAHINAENPGVKPPQAQEQSMPMTKACCLLVRLPVFVSFPALLCGVASLVVPEITVSVQSLANLMLAMLCSISGTPNAGNYIIAIV